MAARKKSSKKAAAKQAVAESPDPRERIAPKAANFDSTLAELEQALGKLEVPTEPTPTDFVTATLHLVFAKGLPCGFGQEARRRIDEEFVDLNEVRVTEAYEVEELLSDLGIPDLFDRCMQARELVAQIYNDQNGVSLEFIREATVSDRTSFFQRVPAYDEELTADLGHLIAWDEIAFSPRSTQRVQIRVGLDPKDKKTEQFIEKLRELLAPFGHLPLAVGADKPGGKPVTEPVLSVASLLLRLSPPHKKRR